MDISYLEFLGEIEDIDKIKFITGVLDSLPCGIIIFQERKFVYVNAYTAKFFDSTRDKLLALNDEQIAESIHPNDREYITGYLLNAVKGNFTPTEYEFRVVLKDHTVKWLRVNDRLAEINCKPAIIQSFEDITEQKRKEEQMRQSSILLKNFLQNSCDGLIVYDERAFVHEFNNSFVSITELNDNDLAGKRIWDVQNRLLIGNKENTNHLITLKKYYLEFFVNGYTDWLYKTENVEISSKVGDIRNIQQFFFPIPTEKGWMLGQIIRNLTELKKFQKQLEIKNIQLNSMIDLSSEGIVLVNYEGKVRLWNKNCTKISGIEEETALNQYAWELYFSLLPKEKQNNAYFAEVKEIIIHALKTGKFHTPDENFVKLIKHDKSTFYLQYNFYPVMIDSQYNLIAFFNDVTNQHKHS